VVVWPLGKRGWSALPARPGAAGGNAGAALGVLRVAAPLRVPPAAGAGLLVADAAHPRFPGSHALFGR